MQCLRAKEYFKKCYYFYTDITGNCDNKKILKCQHTVYKSVSPESHEITCSNRLFRVSTNFGIWFCPQLFFAWWALDKSCWKTKPSTVDTSCANTVHFMAAQFPQCSQSWRGESTCSLQAHASKLQVLLLYWIFLPTDWADSAVLTK